MKKLYTFLGISSLILGLIGLFLPLLPTTPFVLLSAALFSRSSTKMHNWLLNHKFLGKIINDYKVEKAIPMHAKIIAISFMWISIMYAVLVVAADKIWLQVLLLVIATSVSIHILLFKTKKNNQN